MTGVRGRNPPPRFVTDQPPGEAGCVARAATAPRRLFEQARGGYQELVLFGYISRPEPYRGAPVLVPEHRPRSVRPPQLH